ncbi:MAG: phosphomannomutase/phosphoglucomutase, partial [Gaiellaceae bacterium]
MALDPKVFKAYDVRGLYPSELDDEGAYAIGRAYGEHFEPKRIAVGRDMRLSSPSMAEAAMRGAADAGVDVVDIGLVGTEMVYFAVGELGLDGGIAVTASHNPKEYTGMKIVRRGALPVGGDSGLLDVRDRAMALKDVPRGQTPGQVRTHDVYPAFVDKVLSFVDPGAVRPLRVVVDAANGMAGAMLPPLLEHLPVDAVRCYFEPDGSFPNHEPNPLLEENRAFIVAKVKEEGADLGIAFDGDADRCFFVDDTGEFVPGDFVTALLAASMLEKEPGATVIYDVRASWAVRDTVEAAGGTALPNRVGHAFIKHRMREVDAVFAGEVSGHYYFRDFTQADSGT